MWGARVQYEPAAYRDYSDTRPDLTIQTDDGLYIGDTKIFDGVGSDPASTDVRGGHVAFGNTLPRARELVLGRAERGLPGTRFDPRTGLGHVAAIRGAYDRAAARHGLEVQPLLFEVWGGWSAPVVDLLQRSAAERGNKLLKHEYDETTWAARTWAVFAAQRVSCALTRAAAHAIARALSLTTARDPRDD